MANNFLRLICSQSWGLSAAKSASRVLDDTISQAQPLKLVRISERLINYHLVRDSGRACDPELLSVLNLLVVLSSPTCCPKATQA